MTGPGTASRLSRGPVPGSPRVGLAVTAADSAFWQVTADDLAGIDLVSFGDHVSFRGGQGTDGLIHAAAMLGRVTSVQVLVAAYLLVLRHPMAVARQLSDISRIAPGRLLLGVGLGGDDPHELEVCGIHSRDRGRRLDESLELYHELASGHEVDFSGEFFEVRQASVLPAPSPRIPLLIGGRSDRAIARAARHGDGWLALWVSDRRFAAEAVRIAELAEKAGRSQASWTHALQLWVGAGATQASGRERAAEAMHRFYRLPFEKFEKYVPCGKPEQVADYVLRYAESGCSIVSLAIPGLSTREAALFAGEVRALTEFQTNEKVSEKSQLPPPPVTQALTIKLKK